MDKATHKEIPALFKGKKITLQKGQLITGRKSMASQLKISESKIYRIINDFKSEQQIEQQTSNQNALISILNWDKYQQSEQQNEQQMNNERTTDEQPVNTNKNVKNVKNVKNERNNNIYAKANKRKYGEYQNVLLKDEELQLLKQEYSNLFYVEICCHGTMPINIWQDYINVLQTKYGPITDINMRDKCNGWHNFHVTIKFKSGKILSEPFRQNVYMQAFLSDKYLFNTCYTCQFKQGASGADLCIGDFWGIKAGRQYLDDDFGCSFISVYNQSGKDLLNTLLNEFTIEQIAPEEIFKYNGGPHSIINKNKIAKYDKHIFGIDVPGQEVKKALPKKLGIITLHLHTNIGGILQAYALQKTLKELGYDSDVITYDLNNDPRRHLKFVDTHIKVKKVLYETKFTDIKPTDYDGFVVGSDQI